MSFEIQELPDIIRVIILVSGRRRIRKSTLKKRINRIYRPRILIRIGIWTGLSSKWLLKA